MEQNPIFKQSNHKIHIITVLGFLFGLSVSLLAFVGSSYYEEAIDSENVGFFYIIIFSSVLLVLLNLQKILIACGRARTLLTTLVLQIGVMLLLIISDISWTGAILLTAYYILYSVVWVLWDAVLEAYSSDETTGRTRGLFLSVWGLGTLLGPIVAMQVLEKFGFHTIFAMVLILYICMFLIVLFALRNIRGHVGRTVVPIKKLFNKVRTTGALWRIYWVAGTLSFFYAVMTIFMPLHLRNIGFTWDEMGFMFTIMLIPFMLLEYPAGLLADKKWGEKEILVVGFLIVIASTVLVVMMHEPHFWAWVGVLTLSRVGCALIEAMRDTYFYKQIDGKEIALINFFRTARSVAYIGAAAMASVVQLFFSTEMIFYVLIGVMIIGFLPIFHLRDTDPHEM